MDGAEALRLVCRWVRQYERGWFCPAMLWGQIAEVLTGRNVIDLLGEVPMEFQEVLRAVYHERPDSLRNGVEDSPVLQAVERWCLEESN